MKRPVVLLLLAAFLLGSDLDPPGTEVIVTFGAGGFDPARIEIRPATRVTFHNLHPGDETYTIVAADGSFESWPLGPHGEWSHRFTKRGEHTYFLEQRPETRGTAVVR